MKPLRSIRWRLQLWYGILLVLILGGFGFTAVQLERARELARIDQELEQRLKSISRSTRHRGNSSRSKPSARNNSAPDQASDRDEQSGLKKPDLESIDDNLFDGSTGFYYVVWLKNGVPMTRSATAPEDIPQPSDTSNSPRSRGVIREAFIIPNPGDCILVGRSIASNLAELRQLTWKLTGAGLIVLVMGLGGGAWLANRALLPIEKIGATAEKISSGDLSHRIDVAETDSELGHLAGVLNSTFSRLDAAFAQQARFTADAAHELRTPVTVMLTHTQSAIETSCASEEHREAFEACHRAAQRMRRLIESLLELARLDAGQVILHPQPFDLAQVISECVELVQPLAEVKHVIIHHEAQEAPYKGDPDRLGQVILNLLTNAIHYNKEGGAVRIETHLEPRSVLVVVSDTGPGIPEEHLPHIFERFYRVDKARTTSAGRTGLGLAISKAIIEAHHGKITVKNQAKGGASFTLELPLVKTMS